MVGGIQNRKGNRWLRAYRAGTAIRGAVFIYLEKACFTGFFSWGVSFYAKISPAFFPDFIVRFNMYICM